MDHRPMPKALLSAIWCRFSSVLEERIVEVGVGGSTPAQTTVEGVPLQGHTHTTPPSCPRTQASLPNDPMLQPHTVRERLEFRVDEM